MKRKRKERAKTKGESLKNGGRKETAKKEKKGEEVARLGAATKQRKNARR